MAPSFSPGEAVSTIFGAGVVVHHDLQLQQYCVCLWRIPGKSIASSSVAYLQASAIVEKIPVAPGMFTKVVQSSEGKEAEENSKEVLVHCYDATNKTFLVSEVLSDNNKKNESTELSLALSHKQSLPKHVSALQSVTSQELQPAPAAQFYPFLETLMKRADDTVVMTRNMLQSQQTQQFLQHTDRVTSQAVQAASLSANDVKNVAPAAEQGLHQVVQLMKDESLTELLETCKSRLDELVRSTDISKTTQQVLEKTGIRIQLPEKASLQNTRKAALEALNDLLERHNKGEDWHAVREQLATQFSTTFDSLAAAAKSDRQLQQWFGEISDKTAMWQQATGRLLQTRSATLFLEGASRLQNRAVALIRQANWAGDIGSHFTKSFTEGDAAMARVKSLELGEALKSRLVHAIELRSESIGGLDGIIAGALSALDHKGNGDIQALLSNLQKQASSATTNAHETLITVLSSQSEYREAALMRLERVLCSLSSHLGGTPQEIAAMARGEGGTHKIFEPIAKQAMQQIDHHLDAAETQIKDPTILHVLQKVRKIMSGKMSPNDVMDEIVSVLNDDKVVAASETIVQHSEHVLDALEGVSGNKAVADAIQIAERAGITKDSVLQEFGKLNVDELIGTAGTAVTDEKARQQLLSSATDAALDFALRVLPSMPVPPFEGVKDGLIYHISNLSMKGFRVKKEDIHIVLAGMRATKRDHRSSAISTEDNSSSLLGLTKDDSMEVQELETQVKPTELLIIDIREISAVFDNAEWSFEQTYLPYLKGDGKVDVKMSGGAIRLQFELRRRRKQTAEGAEFWEPVLCLHDRECTISDVDMNLQGDSRLAWIINKAAGIFRVPLRDYVVRTIIRIIADRSGWILKRLNDVLSPYWDVILRTAKLKMNDLVEADEHVVVEEVKSQATVIELVWRERLPLGMNLLTNDPSGLLKVVDFPRGSQARAVCEKRNLTPALFEGATIVAVNGTEFETASDAFDALREPGRPKTIRFELAESEEAEKLRLFVEASRTEKVSDGYIRGSPQRNLEYRMVEFMSDRELGIEFGTSVDNACLVVTSFLESPNGIVYEAEKSGKIRINDILTHINGTLVAGKEGPKKAITLLEKSTTQQTMTLQFSDPYMHTVYAQKVSEVPGADCNGGPDELVLEEILRKDGSKRIAVTGFKEVSGMAEGGGIMLGDYLVFVNGFPVGAGCRWLGVEHKPALDDVLEMLQEVSAYPMGLTFARPKQGSSLWEASFGETHLLRDDEAETICITAESSDRIGCLFDQADSGDIMVRDFHGVPGLFHRYFVSCIENDLQLPLSIESLNDELVPSYATVDIVRSALKRGWNSDSSVTMQLCNDRVKDWLYSCCEEGST
ncbi:hypothetical protein FisN_4Hh295 [Fistulifera solaris]|uniref:PDZ domain-containing protein n=1 Tax=Fistulifera solaris TaxID=1519565 RepID=A0A1Z5KET8_FISSO|nr:hypothetical protein FisN_4Hh295 [Fistulifera solaris]|eukprot:GAX24737.1 hypothetical protein FisN_4Hh295 [Fistulifera solaris]